MPDNDLPKKKFKAPPVVPTPDGPQLVSSIPKGAVLSKDKGPKGEDVYEIRTANKALASDRPKAKSNIKVPTKGLPKRPQPKKDETFGSTLEQFYVQPQTVKPIPEETNLYGSVTTNRREDTSNPNPNYKTYLLPDETGNYTNKAIKQTAIGNKVIDPIKSYDAQGNFVPHYTGEVLSTGNVQQIASPTDSGVNTATKSVANFTLPGTKFTQNAYGGSGAGIVNPNVATDKYIPKKYDAQGKEIPLPNTGLQDINTPTLKSEEVGKMRPLVKAPPMKKGGLVSKIKGYVDGGSVTSKYDPNNPISGQGIIQMPGQVQFTPTGNNQNSQGFYTAQKGFDQNVYKKPTEQEQEAQMSQMNKTTSTAIDGLSAISEGDKKGGTGNKVGKTAGKIAGSMGWFAPAMNAQQSVRSGIDRDQMIDPTTGEVYSKAKNKKGAITEETVTPYHERFMNQIKNEGGLDKKELGVSAAVHLLGLPGGTATAQMISNKVYGEDKRRDKEQANIDKVKENIKAANTISKQQQAIVARDAGEVDERLTDIYNPNSYTYSAGYNKGGLVGKVMQKCADGGVIKGKGTAKSDSILAKVEDGSFVVPAKNAKVAEVIREKLLIKAPKSKANLNQKNGEKVKLSNGEHLFTPEEKQELIIKGVDVNKLAPEAEQKEYLQVPKIVGYAKGGEVDPAKEKAKIKAEEDVIKSAQKKKEDYASLLEKEREKQEYSRLLKKDRESKIKSWETKHNDAKIKLNALKKAYEDYSKSTSSNPITKQDRSIGVEGIKNPEKIREDKKKILSDIEKAQKEYNSAKTTYDYVKNDSNYTPEGLSKFEASKGVKAPKLPVAVKKEDVVVSPKTATTPIKTTGTGTSVSKTSVGKNTYTAPSTEQATSDEVVIPNNVSASNQVDINAKVLSDSAFAADTKNNPALKTTKVPRKGLAERLSNANIDPTMFVGPMQAALGNKMLGETKRPEYNPVLDKTVDANVNKAIADAQFGLSPEERFAATQNMQNAENDARYSARNLSGGNAGQAFNQERMAINSGLANKLNMQIADQQLRREKQQYANSLAANRATTIADNKKDVFNIANQAFNQRQDAGAELLGAGLANTIGAYRYNRNNQMSNQVNQQANPWLNYNYNPNV